MTQEQFETRGGCARFQLPAPERTAPAPDEQSERHQERNRRLAKVLIASGVRIDWSAVEDEAPF